VSGDNIIIGGIVKHRHGYGFKITCSSKDHANKYKDMIRWIIQNDKIPIVYNLGYHDFFDAEGKRNGLL